MNNDKVIPILDKCLECLLYCLIFFMPISIAAIEICFGFAFAVFIVKKILQPDLRLFKNTAFIYLVIFLIFCSLSIGNSGIYFLKGLRAILGKWLENILIFIIVLDTFNTPKKIKRALLVLLITAVLIGVDSVYQQFTRIEFIRQNKIFGGPIAATFKTPNSLAAYFSPILLFLLVLLVERKQRLKNIITYSFLIILSGTAIMLTYSRGSWVGVIAAMFLAAALTKNSKKMVFFILAFMVILMAVPITRQKVLYSFSPGGDNFRFAITNITWAVINENPLLGKGIGTYMLHFKRLAPAGLGIQYAHNCYLQIWAECGIFALLSFILFLVVVLGRAIRSYKRSRNSVHLGLICGIFGFLVHALFDNHLYSLQLAVYFWFLMGLLVSVTKIEEAKRGVAF